MRDAMATAAVFEPEEARVLESAVVLTAGKLKTMAGRDHAVSPTELAKLVHDLGRSRLRLQKPLQTARHAAEIADEAVEHLGYIRAVPGGDVHEPGAISRPARIVGAFPVSFRQPPVGPL